MKVIVSFEDGARTWTDWVWVEVDGFGAFQEVVPTKSGFPNFSAGLFRSLPSECRFPMHLSVEDVVDTWVRRGARLPRLEHLECVLA